MAKKSIKYVSATVILVEEEKLCKKKVTVWWKIVFEILFVHNLYCNDYLFLTILLFLFDLKPLNCTNWTEF